MRTTIDKAGRLVIPKQLRELVGLIETSVAVAITVADHEPHEVALRTVGAS